MARSREGACVRRGDSLQSSMFNSRTELADAFAAPRKKAAAAARRR